MVERHMEIANAILMGYMEQVRPSDLLGGLAVAAGVLLAGLKQYAEGHPDVAKIDEMFLEMAGIAKKRTIDGTWEEISLN